MSQTVLWLTDSTNLTGYLVKGSVKPDIQKDVFEVFKLAHALKLVLLPIHLRREDPKIVMADAGSKWKDSDDWSVSRQTDF